MAIRFKFVEPVDLNVVELDPISGSIDTSVTDATIEYKMNTNAGARPDVTLNIDDQIFVVEDLNDLISFLATVRDRLCKIG